MTSGLFSSRLELKLNLKSSLRPELDGFVSVDDLSKPDFEVEKVYRTVSPALAFQVKVLLSFHWKIEFQID